MTGSQVPLFGHFGDDGSLIGRQAMEFHIKHSEVMGALIRLARQYRRAGHGAWSINGAFEVLRWERHIDGLPDATEAFKLNNNYRAWYARRIMEMEPDLANPPIFELRRLQS